MGHYTYVLTPRHQGLIKVVLIFYEHVTDSEKNYVRKRKKVFVHHYNGLADDYCGFDHKA